MKRILIIRNINEFDNPSSKDIESGIKKYTKAENIYVITYLNDISIFLSDDKKPKIFIGDLDINTFDKVIFLTWESKRELVSSIKEYCIKFNIEQRDINDQIGNMRSAKLFQMMKCACNNLPIPKTIYYSWELLSTKYEEILNFLGKNFIMKLTTGSKGTNVHLIKTESEFLSCIENYPSQELIFQEFIPNKFDYRLNIFNYKVAVGTKRLRSEVEEFRNNTFLGATETYTKRNETDPELVLLGENCSTIFKKQLAGVDIIKSTVDNKYRIIEVNDNPGMTNNTIEEEEFYLWLLSL